MTKSIWNCYILAIILIIISQRLCAQDNFLSQTPFFPQLDNPAYTGKNDIISLSTGYRNHHPQMGNQFTTHFINLDVGFRDKKSGLGFTLTNDKQVDEILNSYDMKLSYAYHLNLTNRLRMSTGIQGGVHFSSLDVSRITLPGGSSYDGNLPDHLKDNNIVADFSAGILLYTSAFSAGVSINHLSNPSISFMDANYSFAIVPVRYNIFLKGDIPLVKVYDKPVLTLSPTLNYARQGEFDLIYAGGLVNYKSFHAGLLTKNELKFTPNSLVLLSGFNYKSMSVLYSFDLAINQLYGSTNGAHEISVSFAIFDFGKQKKCFCN